MKSNLSLALVLFLLLLVKSSYSSDSTFVLDTIEIRQNEKNVMKNYYFENNRLITQEDYYSVFIRSPNHNVMENYLKWKKFNGSEQLIGLGAAVLVTYVFMSLTSKFTFEDLWLMPTASVCLISIGIPGSIIRHHYKVKAITEFNKRKL